jgi:exonuclease SbcC
LTEARADRTASAVRLLRLRVMGLRSFVRETEIDLARLGEQGLFAICGPTGAGKSTILDGIFLALFGRTPRGEASECVSAGALELGVRLTLAQGGREIAVERRYRWGKKRKAEAGSVGDDLRGAPRHPPMRLEERAGEAWAALDLGGRKADDYLATQIVKVTMADFQQAVVLPQGQFDALLRARPAERRTLVASLFRTEHLGSPLNEVLRAREAAVSGEMARLGEAERELGVSEEAAAEAAEAAVTAAAEADLRASELAAIAARAATLREGRRRCAARDEAEAALAAVTRAVEARAGERERVARALRAAGGEGAVAALAAAESAATETARAEAALAIAATAAEAERGAAAKALAEASLERAAEQPAVLAKLGKARQAEERGRDLPALAEAGAAAARALAGAEKARVVTEAALGQARAALAAAEAEEQEARARLATARVGEDERAEALAAEALAALAAAEERVQAVVAAERASVERAVAQREAALAFAEEAARGAEAEAARARAEAERLTADARRAAEEIAQAEAALTGARREAAAADLASTLREGAPCPVCGACAHPGADHRAAALAIELAERGLGAARQLGRAADRALAEASAAASSRDEEARARGAQVEASLADLSAARVALRRQTEGLEVPRAVAEARAQAQRLGERAEALLDALRPAMREAVRARRETEAEAGARLTALNRRAREAEALAKAAAAAQERTARAQAEAGRRADALSEAVRARAEAEGRAATASSAARSRREEVRALLAGIDGRAEGDLFAEEKTAAAWVAELSSRAQALTAREDAARAAEEEARSRRERASLAAREASVRRAEAQARLDQAKAAADEALARAGFASLRELWEARLAPEALARLSAEIEALDREAARLATVAETRRRDVVAEVTEAEAAGAELAHDEARRAAESARERAGQAAAHRDELGRRQARAKQIRAHIDELAPRARRLAQIKQVVSGNQLSELAAERHLAAVERGAAALLRTLSSDRFALVRTEGGAFAVADAAHGGLVRPPSTLSGGETFLVSLALALSLSERIQMAGRTRFDFFFLDEGFGSLDPATLEIALGALERLRGANRVIGMISHVGAIEERMPRRLRVSTERRGGATVVVHEP